MAFEQLTQVLSHVVRLEVEPLEHARKRAQDVVDGLTSLDGLIQSTTGKVFSQEKIRPTPVRQKVEVVLFERVRLPLPSHKSRL